MPTQTRMERLRQRLEALGLKRRELWAHDLDWPAIKALADRLRKRREKESK